LQSIKFFDKGFEDWLLKIQRKFYLFGEKDFPVPPRSFVLFLEKCFEYIESKEGYTSTKK